MNIKRGYRTAPGESWRVQDGDNHAVSTYHVYRSPDGAWEASRGCGLAEKPVTGKQRRKLITAVKADRE